MKLKNIIVALLIGASLHSCDYLDIVPDATPILADASRTNRLPRTLSSPAILSFPII